LGIIIPTDQYFFRRGETTNQTLLVSLVVPGLPTTGSKEEQLLADALRVVHSAVTPQKVRDEVQKLLREATWRHAATSGSAGSDGFTGL
jgi:hypothetical protein